MGNIDISKIFEKQANEVEIKRALEILTQQEHETQHAAAVGLLADAVEFWQKRCKRVEKQRDELIKALEILEKIFADKDFIEEEESEDFLYHVWTLAHGALYNLKRELALEREYLELAEREAVRDGAQKEGAL